MKIALILVLVLSVAKALEESPKVKIDLSGVGTGLQDEIALEPKSQSRSRHNLNIRSSHGMNGWMREDILDIVADFIDDDKEGIAEYTYRALQRKYRQRENWTCVAGENFHAYSRFYKKILIEDLDSDMFVFCFV